MAKFITAAKKFAVAEEGATMVEYGVLIALICAICVAIITAIGIKVSNSFSRANAALP